MKQLEISDETYAKIKDQLGEEDQVADINEIKDLIGKKFFFRTVTYHLVGRVEKRIGNIFQLSNASWVADSGRFMEAIKYGTLEEVEPVGEAYINFDSCVDFFPWKHPLPTQQK